MMAQETRWRPLAPEDITTGLIGRQVALYWPRDSAWHLADIRDFDPVTRTAAVLYATGEAEELDLDHIVEHGHVKLLAHDGPPLALEDITTGLIGRQVALYWPGDSAWHLADIRDFDPVTRTAAVLYATGEAETLDLDYIVQHGHAKLVAREMQ
jgi:hypothetical protein